MRGAIPSARISLSFTAHCGHIKIFQKTQLTQKILQELKDRSVGMVLFYELIEQMRRLERQRQPVIIALERAIVFENARFLSNFRFSAS
jgi:hypothetical protein